MKILVVGEYTGIHSNYFGKPAAEVRHDLQKHFAAKGDKTPIEVEFIDRALLFDYKFTPITNPDTRPDAILAERFDGAEMILSHLIGASRIPVLLPWSEKDGRSLDTAVTTRRLRINKEKNSERATRYQEVAEALERDALVFEEGAIHSSYHQMIHHGREKLDAWRARQAQTAGHVDGSVSYGTVAATKGVTL